MNSRTDFEKYIGEITGSDPDTTSYNERVGDPDELTSVIGMVAINFAALEDKLCEVLKKMLQLENDCGDIITCELSFKQKVNLFWSLYNQLNRDYYFNTFPGFDEEYVKEIVKWLNRSEQIRNNIIHSSISFSHKTGSLTRTKVTAKQRRGLYRLEEKTSITQIFNECDKIGSLIFELDEFQIDIMQKKV